MEPITRHPSYLELDRHALGSAVASDIAQHITTCARCRTYLDRSAHPEPERVPEWVVDALAAPRTRRIRAVRAWTAALSGLAAAAALCLVLLRPPAPEYDGIKGMPAVEVYVNRNGGVSVWDGAPLEPGDRIRLEVAAEEFAHVAVFLDNEPAPTPLYQGPVQPHMRALLPKAWQLDGASRAEHIAVLFSNRALAPADAEAQLRAKYVEHAYVVRLTLSKRLP